MQHGGNIKLTMPKTFRQMTFNLNMCRARSGQLLAISEPTDDNQKFTDNCPVVESTDEATDKVAEEAES